MPDEKENYNYEPFADTEDYKKVNGDIITSWVQILVDRGTEEIDKLLDIATGAGTMVQLFVSQLPAKWKDSLVMCLDQSSEALKLAQSKLETNIDKLKFINSPIEDLDLPENSIDVAIWGNGIHYLNEESQINSLKRIKKALKPFGQVNDSDGNSPGTGLGLPITKSLAEANGAVFQLSSSPDDGTCVEIIFPVSPRDETSK